MTRTLPRGLYAIADTTVIEPDRLIERVGRAIAGGAVAVQYRDKSADAGRRAWEANDLVYLCRSHRVRFIVNDDVELARACGADGVHLGRHDASIEQARQLLGDRAVIGASCYDSLEQARAAIMAGADYIAFGCFFPSTTKPDAVPASIELLRAARAEFIGPIVAIGGITPDNGAALAAAGADLLAAAQGLFGTEDVRAAAAAFTELFAQSRLNYVSNSY